MKISQTLKNIKSSLWTIDNLSSYYWTEGNIRWHILEEEFWLNWTLKEAYEFAWKIHPIIEANNIPNIEIISSEMEYFHKLNDKLNDKLNEFLIEKWVI